MWNNAISHFPQSSEHPLSKYSVHLKEFPQNSNSLCKTQCYDLPYGWFEGRYLHLLPPQINTQCSLNDILAIPAYKELTVWQDVYNQHETLLTSNPLLLLQRQQEKRYHWVILCHTEVCKIYCTRWKDWWLNRAKHVLPDIGIKSQGEIT